MFLTLEEENRLLNEAIGTFDYAQGQNNMIMTKLPWWREISGKDYGEDDYLKDLEGIKLPGFTSSTTTRLSKPIPTISLS